MGTVCERGDLIGVALLEAEMGAANRSVIGGFDNYVGLRLDCKAIPEGEHVDELVLSLRDYQDAKAQVRLARLEAFLSNEPILDGCREGVDNSHLKHNWVENYESLERSVDSVRFVGPSYRQSLRKLGIETVEDLLFTFPHRYLNPAEFLPIAEVRSGQEVVVSGQVRQVKKSRIPSRKMTVTNVCIYDGSGYIWATWFNQDFMAEVLKEGTEVCLRGKALLHQRYGLQMRTPLYDIIRQVDEESDVVHTSRIVPVHPAGGKLTPNFMRRIVKEAVHKYADLPDPLPLSVRHRKHLAGFSYALTEIHFPQGEEGLQMARDRLRFQELFLLQTGLALRKIRLETEAAGLAQPVRGRLLAPFLEKLPFSLTNEQRVALDSIQEDLARPHPMSRLLQGEVGSGKTVVALAALLVAIENGNQGAIMAPTEVLAEQHFGKVAEFLRGSDVRIALLKGGLSAKERCAIVNKVADGRVDLVIGTHSLIQKEIKFKALGLAVVDEQHRFGVRQRLLLKEKGYLPDLLIMTATPIPRTLSLTLYGDLDLSIMKGRPTGGGVGERITTIHCGRNQRERAYQRLRKEVKAGRQAYIVCPLIEESDKLEAKAVLEEADHLKNEVFPDLRVGIVHGKLKSEEKKNVMEAFRGGHLDILISTTVIEVGIDVPSATVMVVEDADRFGLAQLHQLRGRVGRGEHQAYFILFADPTTEDARARIRAICEISDGFALAEADLAIRGEGQLLGTRQAGLPDLRLSKLPDDLETLVEARKIAFKLVLDDPGLKTPQHALLLREIKRAFSADLAWLFRS